MTQEKEVFLDRWSRLKREGEAPEKPVLPAEKTQKEDPAAVLPPVEQLKPESDFVPFMDPKVDGETRRAALKKLFADAHFNVPDPFEAYSEDYTGGEPIPMEMLKTLNQARKLLFDEPEKAAQAPSSQPEPETAQTPPQDPPDVAGKQDS